MINQSLEIENDLRNIVLTDNYRSKEYVKNFSYHVDGLIETCSELIEYSFTEHENFRLTESVYWGCESIILEKLDDLTDKDFLDRLNNIEDHLYSVLNKQIKSTSKSNDQYFIGRMIDLTISNVLLFLKFEMFSQGKKYRNPWISAKNILLENNLAYTFSEDIDRLKHVGLKINKNESELINRNLVGVVGKGNRQNFATGVYRDLTGLRNILFETLDEDNNISSNPIKKDEIINFFRSLGLKSEEFSDNNIKSWIIDPLKRTNRIGSNNDGYFVIRTAEDLLTSYNRHLESFKGYYSTLENHKKLAEKFEIPVELLNIHNTFKT